MNKLEKENEDLLSQLQWSLRNEQKLKERVDEQFAELTRLKAELWVANDRPLRSYDGLIDNLQCAVDALNKIAMLACGASAYTSQFTEQARNIAVKALSELEQGKK